ncbi:MAG TPA: thiamine pyrophosphate-binding protein [Acidimicrobiia bacterium]|nr:thiamine pyrophosphate-binding protein [Acidimicrobiia bacterium]
MSERVQAGRVVAQTLRASGVTHVFCLQGGHVDPILFGCEAEGIRIVDTRHEQAAAHMAEGWALATGETGVCVVTAGPGLSDAVTGLANASMSGSPILCLAGARPLAEADTWPLQDLDQLGIVTPITKWARSCATATRAGEYVAFALAQARAGRPGPVYLDIPVDVLAREVDIPDPIPRAVRASPPGADPAVVAQVGAELRASQRPIVLVGSGAHWAGAGAALGHAAETIGLPVFSISAGRGVLPDAHEWSFGPPAPIGGAFIDALDTDLVLCLGVRLGFPLMNGAVFAGKRVVRVDLDGAETARNRPGDVNVVADVRVFCEQLTDAWDGGVSAPHRAWAARLRAAETASKAELAARAAAHVGKPVHPLQLVDAIVDAAGPDAVLVADGGDSLTWGMIAFPSYGDGRLLSTGIYLGCLGVGLPFALAAKLANPSRPVVLLCGDGTFGLNAMELDTAVRHDIPIVCVISNDGSWGMSRHGQVRNHGHTVATDLGVRPYHEVARALGGYGEFVDEASEIRGAIERASASGLPSVVNVAIDPEICSPYTEMMAALESG